MATCPFCNQTIDDDGYYCEYCGKKLYICPQCFPTTHKYGKGEGKRCGNCGAPLVPADPQDRGNTGGSTLDAPSQPSQPQQIQQPPQQPQWQPQQQPPQQQWQPQQQPQQPQQPQQIQQPLQQSQPQPFFSGTAPSVPSSPSMPTSLYCQAMNTRLMLIDSGIIGREQGNYTAQLSTFIYISSIHARFNQTPSGWTITDLGSRNGTKVNGIPCAPTQNISVGDVVRIANFYNFIVE